MGSGQFSCIHGTREIPQPPALFDLTLHRQGATRHRRGRTHMEAMRDPGEQHGGLPLVALVQSLHHGVLMYVYLTCHNR